MLFKKKKGEFLSPRPHLKQGCQ